MAAPAALAVATAADGGSCEPALVVTDVEEESTAGAAL